VDCTDGKVCLVSVSRNDVVIAHRVPNLGLIRVGPLSRKEWLRLLSESLFLLGLGKPLAGPSAVEAVVHGSVFINPVYPVERVRSNVQTKFGPPFETDPNMMGFLSQHPDLSAEDAKVVDPASHRVCNVIMSKAGLLDGEQLIACVLHALKHGRSSLDMPGATGRLPVDPHPLPWFSRTALRNRVKSIFRDAVPDLANVPDI
jgi:hypothetical protein